MVEQAIDLENSFIVVEEEVSDQTTAPENPPDGLFTQIINFLLEWLKSAMVMIKELVAEKVITPELCLGETCIIEGQLKDLLGGKQKIEASVNEQEIVPPARVSSTTDITATNTAAPSGDAGATTTPVN